MTTLYYLVAMLQVLAIKTGGNQVYKIDYLFLYGTPVASIEVSSSTDWKLGTDESSPNFPLCNDNPTIDNGTPEYVCI